MASSSINTCLLILALIASCYVSHTIANSNRNIVSVTLAGGRLFCTADGNPDRSCGNLSCPPAVNATVSLAVERSNIVLGTTTTSATGTFGFNLVYNATNPAPITSSQVNNLVVIVNLPVANCTNLAGVGALTGSLSDRDTNTAAGKVVTLTLRRFRRT